MNEWGGKIKTRCINKIAMMKKNPLITKIICSFTTNYEFGDNVT